MGCQFRVCVAADTQAARQALAAAQGKARQLELILSRFREDSDLNRLNRAAGTPLEVHPILWRAVRWSLWAARVTGGLYDPTVLDRLEAAGYAVSFERLHEAGPLPPSDARSFGRWRAVRVDPRVPVVQLPAGVRMDLGGMGKALAAEWLAGELRAFGPCLVEAGGDVAVRGAPPGWPGWPVSVEAPCRRLGVLWLDRGGLATSGTDARRWRAGDRWAHHVVDPRTGLPAATDVACATVWARHAAVANAHALALVVLGTQAADGYLRRFPGLRVALVRWDGSVHLQGLTLEEVG